MRFFGSALFAVATLASIVSGQVSGTATAPPAASTTPDVPSADAGSGAPNPISAPTAGDEFKAGKPVTIVWKPTSEGTVTLRLRKGDSENLDTVLEISSDIPNSGTYTWTPSTKLEGDSDYAIEIIDEAGESNYSPMFAVDSNGKGLSTATTMSTSTTKTTSSAATTTTDAEEEEETESSSTTTTTKSTKTTTSDASTKTDEAEEEEVEEEEEEDSVPNTNAASGITSSPLALVLCLAAAVAYLN